MEANLTQERITPYSDEELDYFRGIIHKKKEEAEQEVDFLKKMLKDRSEKDIDEPLYSHHMGDAGSDVENREYSWMLIQRTQKFINALNGALDRIEDKTYGICKKTGKKIPKGRLEAVPHTQHSIEAKMRR